MRTHPIAHRASPGRTARRTNAWIFAHGMDNAGFRRLSRNRIRFRHEVVGRFHAADTRAVYGCYGVVECLPSVTRAPHTSSGNRLRGLDRYRRCGYCHFGYRSAGRPCVASAGALHCFHCGRRDWIEACLRELRIAARGVRVVTSFSDAFSLVAAASVHDSGDGPRPALPPPSRGTPLKRCES
jgi:hypothetical protein